MNPMIDQALKLEGYVKQLNALEGALGSLCTVEHTIHEAVVLDELTDPLLNIAGGLANYCVSKLSIEPIYATPDITTRSIIANTITASTEKTYRQLLPIRNRAVGNLIKKYAEHVKQQCLYLQQYSGRVFPAVRSAALYGISGLSGVRVVNDVAVRNLLGSGIDRTTHQNPAEIIHEIYGAMVASMISVATDQRTNEYLEVNVERFPQGDGFSPVRFEGDLLVWKSRMDAFLSKFYNMSAADGQAWDHPQVFGDKVDQFQIVSMTSQDMTTLTETLNRMTNSLVENIGGSPVLNSAELNQQIADAVIENPLHIKQYGTYYGDSSICDEVEVMINRIAGARLAQLRYLSYGLDNLITALPTIMNYCLRDKIN